MAIGKKNTIINAESYLSFQEQGYQLNITQLMDPGQPGYAIYRQFFGPNPERDPLRGQGSAKDLIRIFSEGLWFEEEGDVAFGDEEHTPVFSIEYEDEAVEDGSGLFPVTYQTIKLIPNQSHHGLRGFRIQADAANAHIFDDVNWNSMIHMIKMSHTDVAADGFFDYAFQYNTPFDPQEARTVSIDNSVTLVTDIDSEYNFYVQGYEKTAARINEKLLPCMYSFISEKESEYKDKDNSWYNRHISLMNTIEGVFKDVTNKKGEKIAEKDVKVGDYFKTWGRAVRDAERTAREASDGGRLRMPRKFRRLSDKFKNIIFSQVDIDFLTSFAIKKESFPMHMDIKFSTDLGTQFSDALKEAELSATLISQTRPDHGRTALDFFESRETTAGEPHTSSTQNYDTWDITDWWENMSNMPILEDTITVGRNNCTETRIIDKCKPQLMNLLKILLLGKIRDLVRQNSRTLTEIFNDGRLAHSETVFYEIQKIKETNPNEVAQSFFVPNSDKLRMCNFIDTQVKYDTGYKYRIHAYQLVYGTNYQYEQLESEYQPALLNGYIMLEDDGNSAIEMPRFGVHMEPFLKLVKVPYFESSFMKIVDKPPVAPDVNIIPFRGRKRRLLFNLNAGVGDYKLVPEFIGPREEAKIRELEVIQKVSQGDPINYVSDDPPRVFQVFRMNKKPKSYRDFAGKARRRISTKRGPTNLSSASFIDRIRPNRKYYYVFRTVDVHEHTSYPSPVFEVEMVESDGAVYLLTNTVEFETPKTKVPSIPMDKHIHITPSYPHRVVNMAKTIAQAQMSVGRPSAEASVASAYLEQAMIEGVPMTTGGEALLPPSSAHQLNKEDVVLGLATEESIWGKKFKFRFTSKNTGRKFDLNVKFKHVFNYDKDKPNT